MREVDVTWLPESRISCPACVRGGPERKRVSRDIQLELIDPSDRIWSPAPAAETGRIGYQIGHHRRLLEVGKVGNARENSEGGVAQPISQLPHRSTMMGTSSAVRCACLAAAGHMQGICCSLLPVQLHARRRHRLGVYGTLARAR
jgi:hypothetical protein